MAFPRLFSPCVVSTPKAGRLHSLKYSVAAFVLNYSRFKSMAATAVVDAVSVPKRSRTSSASSRKPSSSKSAGATASSSIDAEAKPPRVTKSQIIESLGVCVTDNGGVALLGVGTSDNGATSNKVIDFDAAIDRCLNSWPDLDDSAIAERLHVVVGQHGESSITGTTVATRRQERQSARDALQRLMDRPHGMGITQRTPEWYEARRGMITASDIAQAMGCSKFGNQKQFFIKKCGGPEAPLSGTLAPLMWGIMYEPVANELYCFHNGTKKLTVHEFGLLPHPEIPHLGASPDGITSDGVMVEIKCPWKRRINGEIPLQYYLQIQGQLAVCGLQECDYYECELEETTGIESATFAWAEPFRRGVVIEWQNAPQGMDKHAYLPLELSTDLQSMKAWIDEQVMTVTGRPHFGGAAKDGDGDGGVTTDSVDTKKCMFLDSDDDEKQVQVPVPVLHCWILRKSLSVRVKFDAQVWSNVTQRLQIVWDRVLEYRADQERFQREVIGPPKEPKEPKDSKECKETAEDAIVLPVLELGTLPHSTTSKSACMFIDDDDD